MIKFQGLFLEMFWSKSLKVYNINFQYYSKDKIKEMQPVIAGKFGEKMQNQLKANKIEWYEREGIVKIVVQTLSLANKTLQRTH